MSSHRQTSATHYPVILTQISAPAHIHTSTNQSLAYKASERRHRLHLHRQLGLETILDILGKGSCSWTGHGMIERVEAGDHGNAVWFKVWCNICLYVCDGKVQSSRRLGAGRDCPGMLGSLANTAAEIVGNVQGGTSSAPGGRGCQGDSCKERQGRCECRGQAGRRCEILEEEGSHKKRSKKTKIEFGAKFEAGSV